MIQNLDLTSATAAAGDAWNETSSLEEAVQAAAPKVIAAYLRELEKGHRKGSNEQRKWKAAAEVWEDTTLPLPGAEETR